MVMVMVIVMVNGQWSVRVIFITILSTTSTTSKQIIYSFFSLPFCGSYSDFTVQARTRSAEWSV